MYNKKWEKKRFLITQFQLLILFNPLNKGFLPKVIKTRFHDDVSTTEYRVILLSIWLDRGVYVVLRNEKLYNF